MRSREEGEEEGCFEFQFLLLHFLSSLWPLISLPSFAHCITAAVADQGDPRASMVSPNGVTFVDKAVEFSTEYYINCFLKDRWKILLLFS